MNTALATVLLCLGFYAPAASAPQDQPSRPDFSGTWKFNAAKSDTAGAPPRSSWILQIKQTGTQFEMTQTVEGTVGTPLKIDIGGKAVPDTSGKFGDATVRYWWVGESLVSEFKWDTGTQKDVRTLSADRKVLTDVRTIDETAVGIPGPRIMRLVFERQ